MISILFVLISNTPLYILRVVSSFFYVFANFFLLQMKFIKEEVLGDELGTLRNRMGVCEKELQQLGGNITRN